jgi:hypothetical protein
MNINKIASLLLLDLGLVYSCQAADFDARPEARKRATAASLAVSTNLQAYHVRAGGPRSFVLLTNAPASNRVGISVATWGDSEANFRLTNGEPHAILLWNVRVQTRSTGGGTDGFGWDTVSDDYPVGAAGYNSAHYPPGSIGEFQVRHPDKKPWRVCVLYSIDWTDSGKSYSGNYEAIGQELKE